MTARQLIAAVENLLDLAAGEELAYVLVVVPLRPTGTPATKAVALHGTNLNDEAAAHLLADYSAALSEK